LTAAPFQSRVDLSKLTIPLVITWTFSALAGIGFVNLPADRAHLDITKTAASDPTEYNLHILRRIVGINPVSLDSLGNAS